MVHLDDVVKPKFALKKQIVKPRLAAKVIDGSIAGMVGVLCTFPLDLAKTRLQNQVVTPNQPRLYTNPFQTVVVVARNEGIAACYSGLSVNFAFISFEKAAKLAANDFFRGVLMDKKTNTISVPAEVLAGGMAGFLQSSITTPMELLKIQGQGTGAKFDAIATMKALHAEQGLKGFYKGWCATLVRDIPFSMVYFPAYANLKCLEPMGGGAWWNLISGMIAGSLGGLLSTPMDVVKTRIQTNTKEGARPSYLKFASSIVREEGPQALLKGSTPRMICIGSLFAVAQTFYEFCIGDKVLKKLGV